MKTFEFYQDEKVTIWRRVKFSVVAKTKEDAIKIILREGEERGDIASQFTYNGGELLYDTEELMLPNENGGYATIEIFDEKENFICNNAD